MVGITSYGAYIPMYRMSLETMAQTWGGFAGKGEKAVANWDEDSLTMARNNQSTVLTVWIGR